jgi:RecA/RadA recombinase
MSLMNRMKKSTITKSVSVLTDSEMLNKKDETTTSIPAINIALSGEVDGGLKSGISMAAGPSRFFKTMYGMFLASEYLKKHKDSVMLFFDSEGGANMDAFRSFDIDTDRVLHIPIENIEELSFELAKKLAKNDPDAIKRGDKVFILVDSLGNLASKRESDNAENENTAKDMSRASSLKSFFRVIPPMINRCDIPCFMINHTYMEMSVTPKQIVGGGQGPMLASDNVWVLGKQQDKDGTELLGYNFIINVEKSRYVKEKSKIAINVKFNGGIYRWSGLLEMATEAGYIKQSGAWYQTVDFSTGELIEKKIRQSDIGDSFYEELIKQEGFKLWVRNRYKLAQVKMLSEKEIEEAFDDLSTDEDI